jgi:hydroxymethylbilane synthase
VDHRGTRLSVTAERALLAKLHGGCSAPIAAWGRVEGSQLLLDGIVADLSGRSVIRASGTASLNDAEKLGLEVAEKLLKKGAEAILASLTS